VIPEPRQNELVRFGAFEADLSSGELRKDGAKLKLQELPFRLLVCLLEHPGEVVTREELQAKLWPTGTFVDFERGLATALNKLREALGDSAVTPRFIETIPRRGYRFVAPVRTAEESQPPTLPSWRKYTWSAAALVVLVLGTVFVWLRTRIEPMTDHDVLVLADFTNSTGDPMFDGVLRDALAYQLEQSPFLKVLDDVVMRDDLQRMRRPLQGQITNDMAREICIREADKAMLGGSIAGLGKSYAIELKATDCQSGRTLSREHSEASDKDHVLQALAKAAQGMRAKLGESLNTIQETAPANATNAFFNVTTGSLEAFQAFRAGTELYSQGRASEAVPVLQRATELDTDLALAWSWLELAYSNSGGSRERIQEYDDRAWALRDRASAHERLWITSQRRGQTLGEYIRNFEMWARTYPRDGYPITALGRLYVATGEFENALAKFQEAYALQSNRYPLEIMDLVMMYSRLDRFDEAKATAGKMIAHGGDGLFLRLPLLAIAYAEADRASAAKQIEWFRGKPEEYRSVGVQAAEAKARGQLRRSRELLQHAAELARVRNGPEAAAQYLQPDSGGDALIGNCQAARSYPSAPRSIAPPMGKDGVAEAALALCGSPALAEKAEKLNREWVSSVSENPARVPLRRAAVALGLGHPDRAIELLKGIAPYERAYPMATYIRGLAYLKVKRVAQAAAEFQKILDHRGANWGPLYPLSYVGVARGSALMADKTRARKAYEDFFDLWKDADPDVPILIEARKEYGRLAQ
jgi:DNA-binding winged helix-turn-helix (wHTH) protein/tetratricopeptide (TPR) repeat protein